MNKNRGDLKQMEIERGKTFVGGAPELQAEEILKRIKREKTDPLANALSNLRNPH